MNANSKNPWMDFIINSKNCGSEIDSAADGQIKLFLTENPEGPHKLDLAKTYD